MRTVNVAVFGATGYSGEELLRRLERHPRVNVTCVTSRQSAGRSVAEVFPWIDRRSPLAGVLFEDPARANLVGIDFAFLALPHGAAAEFASPLLERAVRVLDLSADFRVRDSLVYREFYGQDHPVPALLSEAVYGLPEVYRERLAGARLVACPGCYPTSILLPLIPLLRANLLDPAGIIANSLSGVSGAGRKVDVALLFVECNESARPYGLPGHRHLSEIEQELSLAASREVRIQFAPHLIPLNRGILSTIHADAVEPLDAAALGAVYEEYYHDARFVRLLGDHAFPDIKNVAFTNFIEIAWRIDPRTGKVIVMSAEDNLVKGAAGQAIQCFNLMNGWEEELGL
jgi:N-acetyl-gamma-glutamyl-phosphate reductase